MSTHMTMKRLFLIAGLVLSMPLLGACAADYDTSGYQMPGRRLTHTDEQAAAREQFKVYDPVEGTNRAVYKFNAKFDKYVFLPVVDAYDFVVPDYADARISSFFSNVSEFSNVTNAALQAKPAKVATGVGRFAINTTVGLLGLYDPASHIGLKQHREDFGQTLGVWGVKPGAYVMLPVLGPSNVRDTAGLIVDTVAFSAAVPNHIEDKTAYKATYYGVKPVNTRANTDFRYTETGSPFEYELVRYMTSEGRRLAVED